MQTNRVLFTGKKESFLTRILTKKVAESGAICEFVPLTVNEINSHWEGTNLVTLYLGEDERPDSDALRFLMDKMTDDGVLMIVIGGQQETRYIIDRVPKDLIYRIFVRPIENEEYLRSVDEVLKKIEAGEFRKTILIVDDDPNYMALVREWLKGPYRVAMANSGLQAIKWLGKNKVDLILLDHEMPVTSGPQVLEMLRSDEETRDIPVMFLTGKSDKESVMQVVALKPEGYFLKTIGKDELLEKLAEFFILRK